MNTLREYERWRPCPSSRKRPAASISSATGACSSRIESASSLESLIQLPLKLFGVRPPYIWKRTTNNVVSLPQMQSSGERTISADQNDAAPRRSFHAHLMVAMSPSLSTPHMRRGTFGSSSHEAIGKAGRLVSDRPLGRSRDQAPAANGRRPRLFDVLVPGSARI